MGPGPLLTQPLAGQQLKLTSKGTSTCDPALLSPLSLAFHCCWGRANRQRISHSPWAAQLRPPASPLLSTATFPSSCSSFSLHRTQK